MQYISGIYCQFGGLFVTYHLLREGNSIDKWISPYKSLKMGKEKPTGKHPVLKILEFHSSLQTFQKATKSFTTIFCSPKGAEGFRDPLWKDPGSRPKNPPWKNQKRQLTSASHVSKRPYPTKSLPQGDPASPLALMAPLSEAFRRILHNHPAEQFGRQIHSLYMDDRSWFCNRASICVSIAKSWRQETAYLQLGEELSKWRVATRFGSATFFRFQRHVTTKNQHLFRWTNRNCLAEIVRYLECPFFSHVPPNKIDFEFFAKMLVKWWKA